MADLKTNIARRKLTDRTFAIVGLIAITVGLATLAALLVTLWRDAQPRLRVPRGTVAVTEGKVPGEGGARMTPEQMAWEARKISGEALQDMLREPQMLPQLVVIEELIDLEAIRKLGRKPADFAKQLKQGGGLKQFARTEHARKLIAEQRFGDLIALKNFMPADRIDQLRKQGALIPLINRSKLTSLVETEGIETLFNKRKLDDAIDEELGKADLALWIEKNELRYRLITKNVLKADQLESLIDSKAFEQFVRNEAQAAQARPREFNTSFFFTLGPSAYPETTGILIAWVDSLFIIAVTMLAALPVGVAAGIYLEEYARKNRLTALIEINIANLAGVPSIVYGLMALGFFVYQLKMQRSILTAGLTLALLVMPIVIMATREAIRAIPQNIREASYACGATKWQTVWYHILPYSSGGILTGSIIGLSRAIGETAPLITIGALTFVTTLPFRSEAPMASMVSFEWLHSGFTAMPLLMYNLTSRPQAAFHNSAALAGIVLILMTLSLNAAAIYLRYRLRKNIKW